MNSEISEEKKKLDVLKIEKKELLKDFNRKTKRDILLSSACALVIGIGAFAFSKVSDLAFDTKYLHITTTYNSEDDVEKVEEKYSSIDEEVLDLMSENGSDSIMMEYENFDGLKIEEKIYSTDFKAEEQEWINFILPILWGGGISVIGATSIYSRAKYLDENIKKENKFIKEQIKSQKKLIKDIKRNK